MVEDLLRRLRTDSIDLLWVHFWNRHTPLIETMSTLNHLVRVGKVRYIGFSDHPAWVCTEAINIFKQHGWESLNALQIDYSLLQRTPEDALLPMAEYEGLGVTPWSPLRGGVLSGKYTYDKHFPHNFLDKIAPAIQNGTSINDVPSEPRPL